MSQPKITAFANEILDNIFSLLIDKDDWLALCKTHRSFKASGQRLLFRDIQIPAQHSAHSTGRCSMLLGALTAASHLLGFVETLQIDCCLKGDLVLERDSIHAILTKVQTIQRLTIFIVDQPHEDLAYDLRNEISSGIIHMLQNQANVKQIIINCPARHLFDAEMLFTLESATTLHVRENTPHLKRLGFPRKPGGQICNIDLQNSIPTDYAQELVYVPDSVRTCLETQETTIFAFKGQHGGFITF
ncbi:unnamed protein product [Alternaria sp. RS040]